MKNTKYELVENDTKTITYLINPKTKEYSDPITLYRIRALKDFGDVKKGDLGGYVDKATFIDFNSDCWVYDDSIVISSTIDDTCCVKDSSVVITSILKGGIIIENSVVYVSQIKGDTIQIIKEIINFVCGELIYHDLSPRNCYHNSEWKYHINIPNPKTLVYLDLLGIARPMPEYSFRVEYLLREAGIGADNYILAGGYSENGRLNITWKPSFSCRDMLRIQPVKTRHEIPLTTFYGDCGILYTNRTLSSEEVQEILSRKCSSALTREHDEPLLGESGNIIPRDKITGPHGDKSLADMFKYVNTNYDDIDKHSLYVTHHRGVPVFEPEVDNDMMNENEPDKLLRLHKIKIMDNAATPLRLTYRNEYNRDVICHVMKIQKTNDDGAPLYHKVFTSEGVCPCCGSLDDRCICDPDDENDYEESSLAELWLSLFEDNILFEY